MARSHPVVGVAVVAVLLTATVLGRGQTTRNFDGVLTGGLPVGFELVSSRQPTPGNWEVQRQEGNGYLVHEADATVDGLSLALAPDEPVRDVGVTTRLRMAGGGRAGGLVWRYQDPDNYYAVVLNLTRGTLSLYRFVDGNRIRIERKSNLELDVDAWHVLKIWHDEAFFYVSLGGIRVFDERDRRLDRFGAGRVGVLAIGDSTVWFDDLVVEPEENQR